MACFRFECFILSNFFALTQLVSDLNEPRVIEKKSYGVVYMPNLVFISINEFNVIVLIQ